MSWVEYVGSLTEDQAISLGFASLEAALKYASLLDASNEVKPAKKGK